MACPGTCGGGKGPSIWVLLSIAILGSMIGTWLVMRHREQQPLVTAYGDEPRILK